MKTNLLLTLALAMAFFVACNDSDEIITHGLPSEFPLEVGNAWQYEHLTYHRDGSLDTSFFDTLQITGIHQDYYIYDWNYLTSSYLVKNENGILKKFGYINYDTVYYPDPEVLFIFNETGTLNVEEYYGTQSFIDSLTISTLEVNFDGEQYNSYIETKYLNTSYEFIPDRVETMYNKAGFYGEAQYYSNGNLMSEVHLIKRLD
ncbi:MAG TPA: hypothetical protein VJ937_12005 [Salinivirga sp.]|uniref:hypothetical protein n=1 Tax=Salinivirga sp. TaxID=1970192 RepID=UPI002B48B340|nr:hypothetical protein [Salinivirga sp.]HKK60196.1 hypothetical protein [Salinivirga sp.]